MGKIRNDPTESEKVLLNALANYPDIPVKELLKHTKYKWMSTVVRKIENLKRNGIVLGPLYDIDYGKLCRNPLHKLFCILESKWDLNLVVSYLRLIEPLHWIYPVLSPHKTIMNAGFFSSDDTETQSLLQLLKDHDIITDYLVRIYSHRRMVENPNFFGDPNPSLNNLLHPCELPDMSLGHHETTWNECDISILPHINRGARLTEILREERKTGRMWTYDQIRYSHEKMAKNGLISKIYIMCPFLSNQCADFDLFVKTEDSNLTERILHNFARGARVYKEYVLCGEWGMLHCTAHPSFVINLMYNLDKIPEITGKELYQARSSSDCWDLIPPFELKYFDFDEQTLEYPYDVYREHICEKMENEQRQKYKSR